MKPAQTRLAAFLVAFVPTMLLTSATEVAPVEPLTVLHAVVVDDGNGGDGGTSGPDLHAACGGAPLGKGWCPKLTCGEGGGDCSGNWSSMPNRRCAQLCVPPGWNCCGWRIDTSSDCQCVDSDPEPSNYNCGPCGKLYVSPW